MAEKKAGQDLVGVERARFSDLVDEFEAGVARLVKVHAEMSEIATAPTVDAVPTIAPAPAEPRVWDLSDEALSNYDAADLVALRGDHRGDEHDIAGCHVCDVLARRLGAV